MIENHGGKVGNMTDGIRQKRYFYLAGLLSLIIIATIGLVFYSLVEDDFDDREIVTRLLTGGFHPFSMSDQDDEGNESTGQVSGWIFGLSTVPILFTQAVRLITRGVPMQDIVKRKLIRINTNLRKFFNPLHNYLSPVALALAVLHYFLSSCPSTILPELGLLLMAFFVGSGVVLNLRIAPDFMKKSLYQLQINLWLTAGLVLILLIGHTVVS